MTRFRLFLTALLGIAPLAGHAPALATDRQDAHETLSAALAKRPLANQIIVAVGADKVSLTAGQSPPSASDTLSGLAADYGMTVQDFGSVEAVAPATIYKYTENPADPNPFEGWDADEIVPVLMGSLSEGQWKALIGKQGLALSDLTSEEQHALFLAIFPGHQARVVPIAAPTAEDFKRIAASGREDDASKAGTIRDLTAQLANARLFLGLKTTLFIPVQPSGATSPSFVMPSGVFPAGAPPFYRLVRPEEPEGDALFGIPIRATVPNTPKEGSLDWNLPGLKTAVDCGSAKTVGQVVARIADATKMEIYADRQIENRTVTIAGSGTRKAGDLLRALAFCVAGTYRKVGPAYVLTDDLMGRAVRRQEWVDLQGEVDMIKAETGSQLARRGAARHGWEELDVLPGTLSPSPEQRNSIAAHFPRGVAETAFQDLTPEEKEIALKEVDALNARATALGGEQIPPPTPETRIQTHIHPSFQVEIPSLPGPIAIDADTTSFFVNGTEAPVTAPTTTTAEAKIPVPAPPAPVDLAGIARSVPRRAVLVHVWTVKSVDALMESMQKIGLNELWLDMFSDGLVRASQNVLDEALKTGAKMGIRVLPTINVWLWDAGVQGTAPDCNIYGDDSHEADIRQRYFYGRHEIETEDIDAPEEMIYQTIFVDPIAPSVADTLTTQIKSLVADPAVTGMVWRCTDLPGYRASDLGSAAALTDLGYADDLRLGFLRAAHADPIDILPDGYAKIDSFLREGGDVSSNDQYAQWRRFLSDTRMQALGSLYKAAQTAAGPDRRIAIMLQQDGYNRNGTGWYGSWDGPPHPVPLYRSSYHSLQDLQNGTLPGTAVGQAKAQSAEALYLVPPASMADAASLAHDLQANVVGKKWDGFVIDARYDSIPIQAMAVRPTNPLAKYDPQPAIPLPH